jgi:Predicted phage phi-C31 gp36 major capsid-like protein
MPFDNIIARGDVPIRDGLLDDVLGIEGAQPGAARTLLRQVPVAKAQNRMAVLSALPTAYWVTGDTGIKQTTEVNWTNKFLQVEELAVIVPVPQNVLDDSDFDIWGESRPLVQDAIDRALDTAIFFGTGAPASFPTNIQSAATTAGNTTDLGTSTTAQGGVYGDLDNLFALVEDDGFNVSGIAASRSLKSALRRARNADGDRQDRDRVNSTLTEIDGTPIAYVMDGLWPVAGGGQKGTLAFAGDFQRQFVLGIRKDVTFEVFREGVIQDNTGAIIYNLLQQDMVALRVTFRAGWQVANTINYANSNAATRYPAAVLRTPAVA